MAEARLKTAWDRTALIACFLYNINKPKEEPEREPEFFNPYRETKRTINPPNHDVLDRGLSNIKK